MYHIGVDLGGTNIVVAIVDSCGNIIESITSPTIKEREGQEIFEDIHFLTNSVLTRSFLNIDQIESIGIGVPGNIDLDKGSIIYANNLKLDHFPVKDYLKQFYDVPIYIANDADCALIGELYFGAAKGYSDAMMVTIGTGIGGSIVIKDQLFTGYFPGATEIGHIIIERNGRQCTCGNKGCFEAYGSATGLIDMTKDMIAGHTCVIHDMIRDHGGHLTAKMTFDAAAQGDEIAAKVLDQYYEYLSIGISNLINIFTPQVVIIGGGVSRQNSVLLNPLNEQVSKMTYGFEMKTKLTIATLGSNAGLIGAAMLYRQYKDTSNTTINA